MMGRVASGMVAGLRSTRIETPEVANGTVSAFEDVGEDGVLRQTDEDVHMVGSQDGCAVKSGGVGAEFYLV